MRVMILLISALCVTGCGHAVMVQNPYPYYAYAPANRASEIGIVSYKTRGSNAEVDSGRFSAYKLMAQACRGKGYVIVADSIPAGDRFYRLPRGGWPQAIRDARNDLPPTPAHISFQCIAH